MALSLRLKELPARRSRDGAESNCHLMIPNRELAFPATFQNFGGQR